MNQYPTPEPQRQQQYDPYNNPYPPQTSYTNNPPAQGYRPQQPQQVQQVQQPQYAQQKAYNDYTNNMPQAEMPLKRGNVASQTWNGLVQFLGKRGLLVAAGSVLALLGFLFLPYYSLFSGYSLAAGTLDDKWWLELVLPLIALVVVIVRQVVPRLQQQKSASALLIAGSGLLGMLIHYWFMNGMISTNYWRFGAWDYLLGMTLVAIGGLLSLV